MTGAMLNKLKIFFKKFFAIDDDPHKIAAGAAVGIFLGIIPGVGIIAALLIASILRLNRAGTLAGVLASNTWLTFVILTPAAYIGGLIFDQNSAELIGQFKAAYGLGYGAFWAKIFFLDIALPLLVGFLIVSVAISLSFYGIIYFLLKYKKLKAK